MLVQNGGVGHADVVRLHLHGQHVERMRGIDSASRSLNLIAGGFCNLANCSRRVELVHAFGQRLIAGAEVRAVGAIEALGLVGQAHLLSQGQAGAGNIQQGVLFRRVHGHVVLADMVVSTNSMMMLVPMPSM